jgi:excisionase family DNA binding protein
MRYQPRPYLPAVVGPLAALVIERELGEQLMEHARRLALNPSERNQRAAEQIQAAVASMRESARQLTSRDESASTGSAGGTAEPVGAAPDAGSSHLLGSGLTVRAVAERCRVSERYIRKLIADEVLSATKPGREWVIDPESVAEYEATARSIA